MEVVELSANNAGPTVASHSPGGCDSVGCDSTQVRCRREAQVTEKERRIARGDGPPRPAMFVEQVAPVPEVKLRRRRLHPHLELLSFERDAAMANPPHMATAMLTLERLLSQSLVSRAATLGPRAGGRELATQVDRHWQELLSHATAAADNATVQLVVIKPAGAQAGLRTHLALRVAGETSERAMAGLEAVWDTVEDLLVAGRSVFEWAPEPEADLARAFMTPERPAELLELVPREHVGERTTRVARWSGPSPCSPRMMQFLKRLAGAAALSVSVRRAVATPTELRWLVKHGCIQSEDVPLFEVRVLVACDDPLTESTRRRLEAALAGLDPMEHRLTLHTVGDESRCGYSSGTGMPPITGRGPIGLARVKHLVALEAAAGIASLPVSEAPHDDVISLPAPPASLPRGQGVTIGQVRRWGVDEPISLSDADSAQHTHICGVTGSGKSALLLNLALGRIREGHGVALIDPHGDLAFDLLRQLPPDRHEDVIVFDPTDVARPIGLNIVEVDPAYPEQKTFVINELFRIFDVLYDMRQVAGPIFEQYFRNAFLALLDDPDRGTDITLLSRFLTDRTFRSSVLRTCSNPLVKAFWQREVDKATGEASLANVATYITSKVGSLVSNDFLLPIVGQQRSGIDFRGVMDDRRILIARLNKGRLGGRSTRLVGMVLVMRFLMAAMSRADQAPKERVPFHLMIDEFQALVTPALAEMLAEARKYRLRLTLAHQNLAQVSAELRAAVLGNVGTTMSFRVGPGDAAALASGMGDTGLSGGLASLPNFHVLLRSNIDGKSFSPFVLRTLPPPSAPALEDDPVEGLLERSRQLYGRPRAEVLAEIGQHHG